MHEKLGIKSPAEFGDPDEWREYVARTVPPAEVAYALAFGRTILFARFYEIRNLVFPHRFCSDLVEITALEEPERTFALDSLNGQIFADLTQLLGNVVQAKCRLHVDATDTGPRQLVDELHSVLVRENACFRSWVHYTEGTEGRLNAQSWEEFVRTSLGAASELDVEFALLMAQLGKLLAHFREQNLALPAHVFARSWFLHYLRGAERNAQARAIVQELTEALQACACA